MSRWLKLVPLMMVIGSVLLPRAQAQKIVIYNPTPGEFVGERTDLFVYAEDSTVKVKASVGGRSVDLKFDGSHWVGKLDLTGLPAGTHTLSVVATENNGDMWQQQIEIITGAPCQIYLEMLGNTNVARPKIHFTIGCTNDGFSVNKSISVMRYWNNGEQSGYAGVAGGSAPLDVDLDLSAFDGQILTLAIEPTGTTDHVNSQKINIYVESSPRFVEDEGVSDGTVLDIQYDRILFARTDNGIHGPYRIYVRDRVSRQDTLIYTSAILSGGTVNVRGYLTLDGAIFEVGDNRYEWKEGTVNGYTGPYAPDGEPPVHADDVFSQLVGDVYQIFRTRDGVTTQLTHDEKLWNKDPIIDGTNVVYAKQVPCCIEVTQPQFGISMFGIGGEEVLAPVRAGRNYVPVANVGYQARNGWVAYTDLVGDASARQQLWVRSPQGEKKSFPNAENVQTLGPNGNFVHRRYTYRPGSFPDRSQHDFYNGFNSTTDIDIGTGLARYIWTSGGLKAVIGNTHFSVNTDPCSLRPKGDPNADAAIDVTDAVYILQTIVGVVTPPDACTQAAVDLNCDGATTIADAVLVLRNIVLGEAFPACTGG